MLHIITMVVMIYYGCCKMFYYVLWKYFVVYFNDLTFSFLFVFFGLLARCIEYMELYINIIKSIIELYLMAQVFARIYRLLQLFIANQPPWLLNQLLTSSKVSLRIEPHCQLALVLVHWCYQENTIYSTYAHQAQVTTNLQVLN